ncbi:MAG: acyltransferase family protein [Candidatus Hodarchaeota archaeon]
MKSGNKGVSKLEMNKFERRYDLDWLRIIATVLVFLFHCSRFFDTFDWHVKNNELDMGITIAQVMLSGFGMPIFFIIAGMGTFYALGFVKSGLYLKDRIIRLLIPLVVGMFTHVSIQVYLERVSKGEFTGSFFEFYPRYFEGLYGFGGNFSWVGHHLWFLFVLLIFTFVTLKPFIYLRKEENLIKISRLSNSLKKPGLILLLTIPLIFTEFINIFVGYLEFGGWNLFSYLIFFIYGYIFASNVQFKQVIEKNRNISIIFGFITTFVVLIIMIIFQDTLLDNTLQLSDFLFFTFRVINGWSWMIVVLALANKYLNKDHKSRKFLNEIVMPFYVLHQTIIVIVGFYMVRLDLNIFSKFVIISSLSFVIIMGLVLIIRKVNALRFLFGMRIKRKNKA